MKRKPKALRKNTAQIDGALALFGGNNSVAGYDDAAFTHRTGELIGRAASDSPAPPKSPAKKDEDMDR